MCALHRLCLHLGGTLTLILSTILELSGRLPIYINSQAAPAIKITRGGSDDAFNLLILKMDFLRTTWWKWVQKGWSVLDNLGAGEPVSVIGECKYISCPLRRFVTAPVKARIQSRWPDQSRAEVLLDPIGSITTYYKTTMKVIRRWNTSYLGKGWKNWDFSSQGRKVFKARWDRAFSNLV